MSSESNQINESSLDVRPKVIPVAMILPFILVTTLFALWGFANDITNPLVRAFKEIFLISNKESSLVQTAFYGGYGTMALPAALLIRKYSFKLGILIGLGLYCIGASLFIPASLYAQFWMFLIALYILTFGLAFLETSANPYILALGPPETATQRLNFAQSFNPMGSIIGMIVASQFILPNLGVASFRDEEIKKHPEYKTMLPGEVDAAVEASLREFKENQPEAHKEMELHDLRVIRFPYVAIAAVVLTVFIGFVFTKMPNPEHTNESLMQVLRNLFNVRYIGGVIAQTFYVGAQIMCWTFVIHYGMTKLGLTAAASQRYNIVAMAIFVSSRFICTAMLKYVRPGLLLCILAIGAMGLTLGVIFTHGMIGMYCLIGVSGCMSLMFPTIYGLALDGLTVDDAKLGSAGLIFAIVGGALMPPLQAGIIDGGPVQLGSITVDSVSASFVLPFICFVVVAIYGWVTSGPRVKPTSAG